MSFARFISPEQGWIDYRLRPIEPRDNAAYSQLIGASLKEDFDGVVRAREVVREFSVVGLSRSSDPTQIIVVAETPDGHVVGSGACGVHPIWFDGQPILAAHLHSLLVQPEFRGRGVATALTQWRFSWVRRHYGVNVMLYAEISQDNIASFKNALKWATDLGQPREIGYVKATARQQKLPKGVTVRQATPADRTLIIDCLNDFNARVNFTPYAPQSAPVCDPGENCPRYFLVEADGQAVGGMAVTFYRDFRARATSSGGIGEFLARITHRTNNSARPEFQCAEMSDIWFKPGAENKMTVLIEELRFRLSRIAQTQRILVQNPKCWAALRRLHWEPEFHYSVAYLRPRQVRPYLENLNTADRV